ncbi:hypothetical protein EIP86_003693 [Pleurotus ostreatoroseus]|nr:hypothetical protein EIP86_003693 [Pleurotus ostreatoroseus]
MISEPTHSCSATPSLTPAKPSRRKWAVRIAPTASSRKRSTKAQSGRKGCRAKSSTSSSSSSSSSSRQTSKPSSYEERFFPEYGCTLRVVHGGHLRTKSRSSKLSIDWRDHAVINKYWQGDRCTACSRTARRKQDKLRHLRISHSQEEFWYCLGVPLDEAAGLGIVIRDNDVVKSWDHIDQLTIGGCGRVLRRVDALKRHVRDSGGRCMHKDVPRDSE